MAGERYLAPFQTPFMRWAGEWDGLIGRDMEASAETRGVDRENPYVEYNRTLSSLYHLDNVLDHMERDDPEATEQDFIYDRVSEEPMKIAYGQFVAGQPDATKLSLDSYKELKHLTNRILFTPWSVRQMQYDLLIADMFKRHRIMHAFGWRPGIDRHDVAIGRLFDPAYEAARREHFPSIDSGIFGDEDRAHFERFSKLAAFNMAGWAQGQSWHGSLQPLRGLDRPQLEQYLLHFFFDTMGVRGNESLRSSLSYTAPTHDKFMHAFKALTSTAAELAEEDLGFSPDTPMTDVMRQTAYFRLRLRYYDAAFDREIVVPDHLLSEPKMADTYTRVMLARRDADLCTQVRIADGARFNNPREDFATLQAAYEALGDSATYSQTSMLALFSSNYDFDYGPALLQTILGTTQESMERGLRILGRLFDAVQSAQSTYSLEHREADIDMIAKRTDVTIALKAMVDTMRQSGFDIDRDLAGLSITAEYDAQSHTILPRLHL